MQLLLVRHAHAGNRSEWPGDDTIRPLSVRGMVQAFAIADALAPYAPTRIVTSGHTRCRQTVEPLGGRIGVPVVVDPRLSERSSRKQVLELVGELAGETAVACSHGDVIPTLLEALIDDGMVVDEPVLWQKGSVWVLERSADRFVRGKYLPPPA